MTPGVAAATAAKTGTRSGISRASILVGTRGPGSTVTRSAAVRTCPPIAASTRQTALSPWRESRSIPVTVTPSPPSMPRQSQGAALDQSPSTCTTPGLAYPWEAIVQPSSCSLGVRPKVARARRVSWR